LEGDIGGYLKEAKASFIGFKDRIVINDIKNLTEIRVALKSSKRDWS